MIQYLRKPDQPMKINLDLRSDVPIYVQIVEQIQQKVLSGELKKGDQLPTVRALAMDLRINFNTVSRAYRLLDETGIISTQQGRGTFILEMPPPEMAERLRAESLAAISRHFLSQIKKLGLTVEQAISHIQAAAIDPNNNLPEKED